MHSCILEDESANVLTEKESAEFQLSRWKWLFQLDHSPLSKDPTYLRRGIPPTSFFWFLKDGINAFSQLSIIWLPSILGQKHHTKHGVVCKKMTKAAKNTTLSEKSVFFLHAKLVKLYNFSKPMDYLSNSDRFKPMKAVFISNGWRQSPNDNDFCLKFSPYSCL